MRYKQTVIGIAWALIRPFITMIVFTIVFNKVAKLPGAGLRAVSAAGIRRHAAVAVFFHRAERIEQQSRQQCEPHFQSLFSAPDRSGGVRDHQLCRFSHHLRADGGDDALVRFPARLAHRDLAAVRGAGIRFRLRRRPLDLRP